MPALRTCTVVVMCSVGMGCFLDVTAEGALSSREKASAAATASERTDRARSGFVPPELGVSIRRPDQEDQEDQEIRDAGAARPIPSPRAGNVDVAMQVPAPMSGAQAPQDAGAVRTPDAQVAQDGAVPPAVDAQVAPTTPPVSAPPLPIHRYDFSGRGSIAVDSIGNADGELRGGTSLDGTGAVQFVGAAEDVLALPSGIMAGLSAFTVIGWLELRSAECWQHLVDFTYYDEQPAQGGNGQTRTLMSALYLTPRGCPDGFPIAGYVTAQSRWRVLGVDEVIGSQPFMLGMRYESTTRTLSVIVDGVVQKQAEVNIHLGDARQ